MNDFTLVPVAYVSLGVHEPAWDQSSQQRSRREPRYAARRRLLRAIAPERDPDTCDVQGEFDAAGTLVGVVVRDTASGEVLAQLSIEQLERLTAAGDQRGLLFERRG